MRRTTEAGGRGAGIVGRWCAGVMLLAGLAWVGPLAAQSAGQSGVFSSPHLANLPTATTLREGHLLFEISHRFDAPVSDGADALWGFDGSVFYRLGLSYGISDRITLGVLRSNLEDNLELDAKALLWSGEGDRVQIGAMGGIAWNTQPFAGADDNESQGYAQLLVDVALGERLALGLVPTYLRNPRIQEPEAGDTFSLGIQGLLRVGEGVGLLGEWILSEERPELAHDSGVFGVQLETRGHAFKILLTNQVRINPTQILGGAPLPFQPDTWRVGFNIVRLIPL